jgi:hypothetical protein
MWVKSINGLNIKILVVVTTVGPAHAIESFQQHSPGKLAYFHVQPQLRKDHEILLSVGVIKSRALAFTVTTNEVGVFLSRLQEWKE